MWSNDRPTAPGFYWCHQRGKTRIVHIWCYKNGTELFTNEDGGASTKDALYDGAQWMATVNPPNPQDQNESAQPAPEENDKSVRKAWVRFSNELHRSPDEPYPGMAEAFEHHFSQSFTDGEWRAESGTWAAAWKAAKRHSAQAQPAPSFADAYQGAMEEVAIWKKRALEAEDLNRRFVAEINGHTHMGEPAQPAPIVPDDVIAQAVTRFLSWKLPKDFHPDGGMVFIPTKGRGYDSPHWPIGTNLFTAEQAREMLHYALAAAPKPTP